MPELRDINTNVIVDDVSKNTNPTGLGIGRKDMAAFQEFHR